MRAAWKVERMEILKAVRLDLRLVVWRVVDLDMTKVVMWAWTMAVEKAAWTVVVMVASTDSSKVVLKAAL